MIRLVNVWFGLLGLRSGKLRSALTMLGVIIGVGAVIVIVSLGNGMRRFGEQQIEQFSSGTIEVRPGGPMGPIGRPVVVKTGGSSSSGVVVTEWGPEGGPGMAPQPMRQPQLEEADLEALRLLATSANGVTAQLQIYGTAIHHGEQLPFAQIMGVTPDFLHVFQCEMEEGRFLTPYDEANAAPVAVIGGQLAKQVFEADVSPLGQVLRISERGFPQNYTIVGVLLSKGEGWSPLSNVVLLPLRTVRIRIKQEPGDRVDMIAVRVDSRQADERQYAVAQINTILAARHGIAPGTPEDFQVRDTLGDIEEMNKIITVLTLVLALIAGISLLVGSIGLMNIMLVGVSERTPEIGVRRAMGARRMDILSQFMSEALILSLTGGIIGFVIGILGSQLISYLIEDLRGMIVVTSDVVAIAVGIASVVGLVSGIYPAWRAARMQPTDALRHT